MFAEYTNAVPCRIEEFALGEPKQQAGQQHCCLTASGPWHQRLTPALTMVISAWLSLLWWVLASVRTNF